MAHGRPDFSPTAVDVVLRPEWAAKEGTDKNFVASGNMAGEGQAVPLSYTVPDGKILYITQYTFVIYALLPADSELNQFGSLNMLNGTTYVYLALDGGNGGGRFVFSKPAVFLAGEELSTVLSNRTNHGCYGAFTVQGYEV